MDNATRYAKQEVTEAGKFLTWLLAESDTTIDGAHAQRVRPIYAAAG